MTNKWCFLLFFGLSPWVADAGAFREEPTKAPEIVEAGSWVDRFAGSNEEVQERYAELEASIAVGIDRGLLSEEGGEKIRDATVFAAEKHRLQFRNNDRKTPYINHPIAVAEAIMRIGGIYDEDIIAAALLHDVMDGTDTTYEEIMAHFGLRVTALVQEITGKEGISDKERNRRQIVEAPSQSSGATVIRLADKLHNLHLLMNDPSRGWDSQAVDAYFQWAETVIDRLPEVNPPLFEAVKDLTDQYWKKNHK